MYKRKHKDTHCQCHLSYEDGNGVFVCDCVCAQIEKQPITTTIL